MSVFTIPGPSEAGLTGYLPEEIEFDSSLSDASMGLPYDAIRKALMLPQGESSDGNAVADVTQKVWHGVTTALEPVVGTRGADALFERTLKMTSVSYPRLALTLPEADCAISSTSFRALFKGEDATSALETSFAMLVTFTELLASLVGMSLTHRLLEPVWVRANTSYDRELGP